MLTAYVLAIDKNGDIELLTFPTFHQELLTQNYWNAGDELGRIKVVISEGFPRESIALPYERIKSVVAFSFQHAPIGKFLEHVTALPHTGRGWSIG